MKHSNLKQKLSALAVTAAASLAASPVFANGDPFQTVTSGAEQAQDSFSTLGFAIAVTMLIVAGIGLMLSQKMREWAKGHIIYVIIGVVVIVLASQAVPFIQQMFGG